MLVYVKNVVASNMIYLDVIYLPLAIVIVKITVCGQFLFKM